MNANKSQSNDARNSSSQLRRKLVADHPPSHSEESKMAFDFWQGDRFSGPFHALTAPVYPASKSWGCVEGWNADEDRFSYMISSDEYSDRAQNPTRSDLCSYRLSDINDDYLPQQEEMRRRALAEGHAVEIGRRPGMKRPSKVRKVTCFLTNLFTLRRPKGAPERGEATIDQTVRGVDETVSEPGKTSCHPESVSQLPTSANSDIRYKIADKTDIVAPLPIVAPKSCKFAKILDYHDPVMVEHVSVEEQREVRPSKGVQWPVGKDVVSRTFPQLQWREDMRPSKGFKWSADKG